MCVCVCVCVYIYIYIYNFLCVKIALSVTDKRAKMLMISDFLYQPTPHHPDPHIQLTLVISTSLISNNRLSRSDNLVPA